MANRFDISTMYVPGELSPVAAHRVVDELGATGLLDELDGQSPFDWSGERVPDYWQDAEADDTHYRVYDLEHEMEGGNWRAVLREAGEPWASRFRRAVEFSAHGWVDRIVELVEQRDSGTVARRPIASGGELFVGILHENTPENLDVFMDDQLLIEQGNQWPSVARALGVVPSRDYQLDVAPRTV